MVYDTIPKGAVIRDRYVVRGVIGKGGGGIVYRAFDRNLQFDVVLKQIREDVTSLLDSRAEVDILKQLKHERLPKVLDFFEYDGRLFTSMDFIRGIDLNTALKTQGRFLQGQVLRWAQELSDALAYLHSQRPPVIHSDIKPGNIMYDSNTDGVTLIDFNISLAFSRSKLGTTWITPGYSPPEQYHSLSDYYDSLEKIGYRSGGQRSGSYPTGGRNTANPGNPNRQPGIYDRYTPPIVAQTVGKGVDARSDVYSFGVTIYHLLTGVKPAPDFADIIPISEFDIDLEPAFAFIIEKCMALDPNERYPDGIALNKALRNIYKLDDDYKEFIKRERRRRLLCGLLIGFGAAMIASGFYLVNSTNGSTYNGIVDEACVLADNGEYPEALDALEDAMDILPGRIDAYVEKARTQYRSGDFDGAIRTVNETEANEEIKKRKSDASLWGDLYYIAGDSFLEKNDYSNANKSFKKAIGEYDGNSLYYRERAVALARGGNADEAESVLQDAKEMQLGEDSARYVEAEIAVARGEDDEAVGIFQEVLDTTSDDELASRSVLMISGIYGKNGDYDKKIDFLNGYVENDRFGTEMQMRLSRELANAWILKGNSKASDADALAECSQHALDELLKIYDYNNSTGTIGDLETISKLYQNIGDLDRSRAFADQMISDYPESYAGYKRKAFVLLYIESGKAENMRSYAEFKVNYDKAEELFAKEKDLSDPEMETLKKEHDDLVKGGWLA